MARTSLADVRSLPDPLLTYNWDIIFPVIPGSGDTRSLTFKALSTSIPGKMLEQVPANLGPAELRYAGRENNSHAWQCTIHETRDTGTRDVLRRWQSIIRNNRLNTGSYKSVYSVPVELVLYDDVPQAVRRIVLLGAWPETLDDSQLDRASGAVQVSVTFSYDDFDEELLV